MEECRATTVVPLGQDGTLLQLHNHRWWYARDRVAHATRPSCARGERALDRLPSGRAGGPGNRMAILRFLPRAV